LKRSIGIEELLSWAYLLELPKDQGSSNAEANWDRLAQYGSLGGIDTRPDAGEIQLQWSGLPDPDAVAVGKAVTALKPRPIDWEKEYEIIAGDLSALVSINDLSGGRPQRSLDTGGSGWGRSQIEKARFDTGADGRGVTAHPAESVRDVLLVNTIRPAPLVVRHAIKGTRPDWRTEQMRPIMMLAERSTLAKVIGRCKAKNLYTTGSYCPLRWSPSPIEVVLARADYRVWHEALCELSRGLSLERFAINPFAASAAPWIETEERGRLFVQVPIRSRPFPLKPQRDLTLPPSKKLKKFKARRLTVDEGQLP
jgi:hypothetical protein